MRTIRPKRAKWMGGSNSAGSPPRGCGFHRVWCLRVALCGSAAEIPATTVRARGGGRKEAVSRGRVGYSSNKSPLHALSASYDQVRPAGSCNHHRSTPASILPPQKSKYSIDMADRKKSQHGLLSVALAALHHVSTMSRSHTMEWTR